MVALGTPVQIPAATEAEWAKTVRVWGDVALVAPQQTDFDNVPTTAAVAVRADGTTGAGVTVPVQTLDPSAALRLSDGVAVVSYRPDTDLGQPSVALRVFTVDRSTLATTLAADWAAPSTWGGAGARLARVDSSRFVVLNRDPNPTTIIVTLRLFEYTAGTLTLLDSLVVTNEGPLTCDGTTAYIHEENTLEKVSVGASTLTAAGTVTTTTLDTYSAPELLHDGTIHFLGALDPRSDVGYRATIDTDDGTTAAAPLGYDAYFQRNGRFLDNTSIDAYGGRVSGIVQGAYAPYDVHLIDLITGADDILDGAQTVGGADAWQHDAVLLGSGVLLTSVNNEGEIWVRVTTARRLLAYNRAFQRGSDGFGVTGGRRAFGVRSQQGSNRVVGFR